MILLFKALRNTLAGSGKAPTMHHGCSLFYVFVHFAIIVSCSLCLFSFNCFFCRPYRNLFWEALFVMRKAYLATYLPLLYVVTSIYLFLRLVPFCQASNRGSQERTSVQVLIPYSWSTNTAKVLLRHEKEKKDKYGALCIARRTTFTPLVFSVDGLLRKEATAASKRLATCLGTKWKRSYSEVCGFVHSGLSIALLHSSSRCLHADRNPTHQFHNPLWESSTGLGLYRM
jgi:hypothetical protein